MAKLFMRNEISYTQKSDYFLKYQNLGLIDGQNKKVFEIVKWFKTFE